QPGRGRGVAARCGPAPADCRSRAGGIASFGKEAHLSGSSLTVRRVAGALGAEISGVDLSADLSDETIAAIRDALVEHQVIFFRGQNLTPAQQVAFGGRFGPLNIHPYVAG